MMIMMRRIIMMRVTMVVVMTLSYFNTSTTLRLSPGEVGEGRAPGIGGT
jgi:hypothetical protein